MQFIDDAAAESDGDEDGRRCRRRVKRAAGSDDEKEEGEVDSDEETEQDRAFINDDSSEEEDEEEDAGPSRKRTRVSRTLPEVDSDDLALLRENAGESVESGASSGETGKCCCVYADSDEDEMSESDLGFVVDSDADPREARHVEGVLRKFREQSGVALKGQRAAKVAPTVAPTPTPAKPVVGAAGPSESAIRACARVAVAPGADDDDEESEYFGVPAAAARPVVAPAKQPPPKAAPAPGPGVARLAAPLAAVFRECRDRVEAQRAQRSGSTAPPRAAPSGPRVRATEDCRQVADIFRKGYKPPPLPTKGKVKEQPVNCVVRDRNGVNMYVDEAGRRTVSDARLDAGGRGYQPSSPRYSPG